MTLHRSLQIKKQDSEEVQDLRLQTRSEPVHVPPAQVIIPEPLSFSYPLAHSNVALTPSGKSFIKSDSLVKTVFFPPSGLGQSAGS